MSMAESEIQSQEFADDNRAYELVYIVQPNLEEEGVRDLTDRVAQIITNHAGANITTEPWGRRTLAYPINRNFEGHYFLVRFNMAPNGTDEVERLLRFNENVLRYLLIRTDA